MIDIIILAAGKGTRMKSDIPKVLSDLNGRPMISYLLDTISQLSLPREPIIVVGYKKEMVKDALGSSYRYVHQKEQLGTGHAVMSALPALSEETSHVIVLYGDMPFVSSSTLSTLIDTHKSSEAPLTMATTDPGDFNGWKAGFNNYGRIIRGEEGEITGICEYRDASEDIRSNTEVNPSYFCIDREWLSDALHNLKNTNASGEYYLTDLAHMASQERGMIPSITIDPIEALGANTKEQFKILKTIQDEHTF
ncbi:MAG: NTP transferase domain-containing protein [Candidatus Paceibacterota bacterium]